MKPVLNPRFTACKSTHCESPGTRPLTGYFPAVGSDYYSLGNSRLRTLWSCGMPFLLRTQVWTLPLGSAWQCSCESATNVSALLPCLWSGSHVSAVIPAEYTEQLTCLMRYPPLDTPIEGVTPVALLVQQAHRLQQFPSPSTGVSVVIQNRDLLNIPVVVPDPPARPARRTRESRAASVPGRPPAMQSQSARESQVGLPEMIARNLLDKSDGLKINRAFFNTVSEIRVRFDAILCVSPDRFQFNREIYPSSLAR